ncbi:hypothetical protein HY570_02100 [Candidatus Micrarchaeota archaeon]|nr:hypothetical protein [Candidatus Micrarchaeota archaeon]
MKWYIGTMAKGLVLLMLWAVTSNFAGAYVYPTFSINYVTEAGFRELGYLVLEILAIVIASAYVGYEIFKAKGLQQEAVLNVLAIMIVYEIVNFLVMPAILGRGIVLVTGSFVTVGEVIVASAVAFITFNLKTKLE